MLLSVLIKNNSHYWKKLRINFLINSLVFYKNSKKKNKKTENELTKIYFFDII